MQLTLSSSAYSRRHFYGANAGAVAQSARLASESSYRSSIRESAIRQPPELLLEMERPGYNGVQRGRHLKVKYLRGGGRGRGKRKDGRRPEISWEISRHFVPCLTVSFVDRRLHPINASSYNAAHLAKLATVGSIKSESVDRRRNGYREVSGSHGHKNGQIFSSAETVGISCQFLQTDSDSQMTLVRHSLISTYSPVTKYFEFRFS